MSKIRLAIDANEANVKNRVGSNVYALKLLEQLHALCKKSSQYQVTVLLSGSKLPDLPKARSNWRYVIVKPSKFWTQWALPIHLFLHRHDYDLFFTPGHYAPRISSVPYISSVMDLAYLHFPEQFKKEDLLQLKKWTRYSVKNAQKIVTISQFSQAEIKKYYARSEQDIEVIYPATNLAKGLGQKRFKTWLKKEGIRPHYFLYLGTLQPRKNLKTLIKAYETYLLQLIANGKKSRAEILAKAPQLVIAGKIGWLSNDLLQQIRDSAFHSQIILTGFIEEKLKRPLYGAAKLCFLPSLYEGFGIPPLEAIEAGTLPVVADNSSLIEVVKNKKLQFSATDYKAIAQKMTDLSLLNKNERQQLLKKLQQQAQEFSWEKSGQKLLTLIKKTIREKDKHGH